MTTLCVLKSLPERSKKSSVTSLFDAFDALGLDHPKTKPVEDEFHSQSELPVSPGKAMGAIDEPKVTAPGVPTVEAASNGTNV